jgi:hypothetical protein
VRGIKFTCNASQNLLETILTESQVIVSLSQDLEVSALVRILLAHRLFQIVQSNFQVLDIVLSLSESSILICELILKLSVIVLLLV